MCKGCKLHREGIALITSSQAACIVSFFCGVAGVFGGVESGIMTASILNITAIFLLILGIRMKRKGYKILKAKEAQQKARKRHAFKKL